MKSKREQKEESWGNRIMNTDLCWDCRHKAKSFIKKELAKERERIVKIIKQVLSPTNSHRTEIIDEIYREIK